MEAKPFLIKIHSFFLRDYVSTFIKEKNIDPTEGAKVGKVYLYLFENKIVYYKDRNRKIDSIISSVKTPSKENAIIFTNLSRIDHMPMFLVYNENIDILTNRSLAKNFVFNNVTISDVEIIANI